MTRTWPQLVFALGFFAWSAPGVVEAACGNGIIDPSEVCVGAPGVLWAPASPLVAVIAADLNADAARDVAAITSTEAFVQFGAAGGFGASTLLTFPAGVALRDIAAGDFNADGHVDLAVADHAGDQIIVRPNLGGGAFGPDNFFALGAAADPIRVFAARMNADARADLVVLSSGLDVVSVLLANPMIPGFLPPVNYAVGDATDIAIGDCNGVNGPDVLYVNNFGTSTALRARRNNGAGGLLAPLSSPLPLFHPTLPPLGAVPSFLQPRALVAGRFNADPFFDVVVASTWAHLWPATSNGNCTFTAEPYGWAFASTYRLRATDFDQDGHLDVAVPHGVSPRYSGAFFGGNLGAFITYDDTMLPAGAGVNDLAFGDWNADGVRDVIVASWVGLLYQPGNP